MGKQQRKMMSANTTSGVQTDLSEEEVEEEEGEVRCRPPCGQD
jgi:hypothetical protein